MSFWFTQLFIDYLVNKLENAATSSRSSWKIPEKSE